LERDTDAYFSGITEDVLREENALAESLSSTAKGIDYDLEA
jgi:hypothetical protein